MSNNPGNNLLPVVPELNEVFANAVVQGALTSVVGPDYVMHPHRALHNNAPGSDWQAMYNDSYWGFTRRVRNHRLRWVMIMYVPQDTPESRGPTGVFPGSQYLVQKPDEAMMPELAGALAAGGFLLIHYDTWHRKMEDFTGDKRFMAKFEFIRTQRRTQPSWNHHDAAWNLTELPGVISRRSGSGNALAARRCRDRARSPGRRCRGAADQRRYRGAARAVNEIAAAAAADAVRAALPALGLKTPTPAIIAALGAAIRDRDEHVRLSAALSLAQMGPGAKAAVPALGKALHDKNRYLPGYAVEALERIASPLALQTQIPFRKASRWYPHTTSKSIF